MGAAMSAVVTLAVEGFSAKPWTIGWDMRLVTAIYSVRSDQTQANTPFIYGSWHDCLISDTAGCGLLWSCLLCARHSDEGERSGVCHCFQPPLHDHNCCLGLHNSSRGNNLRKVSENNEIWHLFLTSTTNTKGNHRDTDAFLLETCSVIGAVIIVVGLYSLIWGKSKDQAKQSSERTAAERTLQLPIAATDAGKFGSSGQVSLIEINAPKNPWSSKRDFVGASQQSSGRCVFFLFLP